MISQFWKESGFSEITAELSFSDGQRKVIGVTHRLIPGIAVVMVSFGAFNVSHLRTGFSMSGNFYRMASALLVFAQWGKVIQSTGFSFENATNDEIREFCKRFGSDEVPFDGFTVTQLGETRKATINEWISATRMIDTFDEFPFEDEDPLDQAFEIFEGLEAA